MDSQDVKTAATAQLSFLKDNWKITAAYVYFAIIIFDFMVAPMTYPILINYFHFPYQIWTPLTLQGGGTFHIAMGAIIGASSFTSGMARVEAVKNMPDYSTMPANYVGAQQQQPVATTTTTTTVVPTGDPTVDNIDPTTYKRGGIR